MKALVHKNEFKIVRGQKVYKGEVVSNAGTHEIQVPEKNIKAHPEKFQMEE